MPRVIVFQYNPDELTRTISPRTASGLERGRGGAEARATCEVGGPPAEQISMTAMLDAADQLEFPAENPDVVRRGLHPAIAALELLVYPPSRVVLANFVLAQLGSRSVTTAEVPMAILVWGPTRLVPVEVTGLSITEQAFDQRLNPIRAEVRLDLNVLTYRELKPGTLAHAAALAHHVAKEGLAERVTGAVGGLPF